MRCLEKAPADRYQTATELEQALAACSSANEWDAQQGAIWWCDVCSRTALAALEESSPDWTAGSGLTSAQQDSQKQKP